MSGGSQSRKDNILIDGIIVFTEPQLKLKSTRVKNSLPYPALWNYCLCTSHNLMGPHANRNCTENIAYILQKSKCFSNAVFLTLNGPLTPQTGRHFLFVDINRMGHKSGGFPARQVKSLNLTQPLPDPHRPRVPPLGRCEGS